jgi:uncharacterized tellurite resistance protein B-like protein
MQKTENMETISLDKLLLKTAFCCMAADGDIDDREITILKSMCEKSPMLSHLNFKEEINLLVGQINSGGKTFIQDYFNLLEQAQMNEQEELTLIDFAIQTINADDQIEYSEIKFFKNIRHRLNVSDEKVLASFPGIELYLEDDIITDGYLDKITSHFFEISELPQFDLIGIADHTATGDKED